MPGRNSNERFVSEACRPGLHETKQAKNVVLAMEIKSLVISAPSLAASPGKRPYKNSAGLYTKYGLAADAKEVAELGKLRRSVKSTRAVLI